MKFWIERSASRRRQWCRLNNKGFRFKTPSDNAKNALAIAEAVCSIKSSLSHQVINVPRSSLKNRRYKPSSIPRRKSQSYKISQDSDNRHSNYDSSKNLRWWVSLWESNNRTHFLSYNSFSDLASNLKFDVLPTSMRNQHAHEIGLGTTMRPDFTE